MTEKQKIAFNGNVQAMAVGIAVLGGMSARAFTAIVFLGRLLRFAVVIAVAVASRSTT